MTDTVKEMLTPSLHSELKQVAPYIVEFNDTAMFTYSYLSGLAKETGSRFHKIRDTKDGKALYKISDPLCKILEDTGMNA